VLADAARFLGEPQSPPALARFLCQVVPQALRLSGSWLSLPGSRAGLVEVEPGVLAPNVSLAAPALLDALQPFNEPIFIARPEDLDAYAGMSAVSADAAGVGAWYAAGARLLVPMRSPTDGLPLAVWALGAPTTGDLLDRDDLATLARVASMAAMQLDRARVWLGAALREQPEVANAELLTGREREVMALLGRGYSNRQIAEELVIGVRTAETHVERILRKLNLENRGQVRRPG
jgi:DNA-binding CsgD family transcriptional regulator